jgi:hypothetical protein
MPIWLTAFAIVAIAGVGDAMHDRPPRKPAFKSFRLYLKEPRVGELDQQSKEP